MDLKLLLGLCQRRFMLDKGKSRGRVRVETVGAGVKRRTNDIRQLVSGQETRAVLRVLRDFFPASLANRMGERRWAGITREPQPSGSADLTAGSEVGYGMLRRGGSEGNEKSWPSPRPSQIRRHDTN